MPFRISVILRFLAPASLVRLKEGQQVKLKNMEYYIEYQKVIDLEKFGPCRYKRKLYYKVRIDQNIFYEGICTNLLWDKRIIIPIEDSLNFQYKTKNPSYFELHPTLLNNDEIEAIKIYIQTGELDTGKVIIFLVNKDCYLFYNKETKEFHCYANSTDAVLRGTEAFKKQIKKYPSLINNSFVRFALKQITFKPCNYHNYSPKTFWYKYDISEPNPLMEDIGCITTSNPFLFTCPTCKNKNSPAGFVGAPKKFYNNNKRFYTTQNDLFLDFKYIIDDPNYIIDSSWYSGKGSVLNDFYNTARLMYASKLTCVPINKALHFCQKLRNVHVQFYTIEDYYLMFRKVYPNVKPISIFDLDLSKVRQMHDDLVKIYNEYKFKINDNAYLQIKTTYPEFEYKNDKFLIKYPDKLSDLPAEGNALKHCVRNYVDRVLEKRAYIMFIRNIDNPDKPFITLHFEGEKEYSIVQAHGICNSNIAEYPGVFEFIEEWANKYNIKITDINKVR
jgi:hypothetical protein